MPGCPWRGHSPGRRRHRRGPTTVGSCRRRVDRPADGRAGRDRREHGAAVGAGGPRRCRAVSRGSRHRPGPATGGRRDARTRGVRHARVDVPRSGRSQRGFRGLRDRRILAAALFPRRPDWRRNVQSVSPGAVTAEHDRMTGISAIDVRRRLGAQVRSGATTGRWASRTKAGATPPLAPLVISPSSSGPSRAGGRRSAR